MRNSVFTNEEIAKFNFYNSGIAFFDVDYEADIEEHQRANKRAASSDFEILKIDSSSKVAVFKNSKSKVFYSTLQGCSCKEFENSDFPCVHMFRLAQELNIIDKETGILLQPQEEIEEYFVSEYHQKTTASTVGIGKHCKYCNSVMKYDDDICSKCGSSQSSKEQASNNYKSGCLIAAAIVFFFIIASIFL